ncbi:MAG: Hpt domain-containing protein [Bacteroidota bacterium]
MENIGTIPVLNPATLRMLRKSTAGNPAYLAELFQSFIDDAYELINEIKTSSAEANYDKFYQAVHTFKGLSATIGCSRMFEVLKTMDALNKEHDFAKSMEQIVWLDEAFSETTRVIKIDIMPHQEK